jgi:hypothetical protein
MRHFFHRKKISEQNFAGNGETHFHERSQIVRKGFMKKIRCLPKTSKLVCISHLEIAIATGGEILA